MPSKKKATAKRATPYADQKSKVAKGLIRVKRGRELLDIAPAALAEHERLGFARIGADEE